MWSEIVKVALIGTDRTTIPDEVRTHLESLGISTKNLTDDQLLLKAATVFATLNRGSRKVSKRITKELPQKIKEKDKKDCPVAASYLLQRMLTEEYEKVLPEFIRLLNQKNIVLPPTALPHFLDKAARSIQFWNTIQEVIGKKGRWLCSLNPQWRHLAPIDDLDVWTNGTLKNRVALLRQLRGQQSPLVAQLLEETQKEESKINQLAFLDVLKDQIQPNDEAYLESCLDSNYQEVRLTAAKQLSQIPDSQWYQRMSAVMNPLITLKSRAAKKEKLDITLPEKIDKAIQRDGINPKKAWAKGGVRAGRFYQMMSLLPPSYWEKLLKQTPENIIAIFARSEWSVLLIEGIIQAAALHKSEKWIKGLLLFWLANHEKARWEKLKIKSLLPAISSAVLNEVLIKQLNKNPACPDQKEPLTQLLHQRGHHWDDKLTFAVIKNIQRWLKSESNRYWGHVHLREVLANTGLSANPELFEYFFKKWPRHHSVWASWDEDIDDFMRMMRFRKAMVDSLKV